MKKITLLALSLLFSIVTFGQVVINEIDCDQTSTDDAEFIELKSDNPNQSLDGYVVVLYNGSDDESYAAFDLDGNTTDADGYFLIGNGNIANFDLELTGVLQNGPDAVALYQDDASSFPNDTPATSTNLVDAIVYDTNDADDTDLLTALGQSVQYDENANGNKDTESLQRATDGTFCAGTPTPDGANIDCSNVCPLSVFVTTVECDDTTTSPDTYTTTLGFNGGASENYTVTSTQGTVNLVNDPSTEAQGTITITGVTEGTDFDYTVTSATCNITNTITSPNCEPTTAVNSISQLRAGTIGQTYTLSSEAVITYMQSYRNQKFIQDNTAAILIDDPDGNITTSYNMGDGLTGITGELDEFNGVMQFRPASDAGAATSTGNTVNIQVISIQDFLANAESYESELIAFENVSITEGDGTAVFDTGSQYTITNGPDNVTLYTNFFSADYIDTLIPDFQLNNIAGIAGEFQGTPQLYPRSSDDFNSTLSVNSNKKLNFSIYPNPATKGFINIETENEGAAQVTVFDILGKQVINQEVNNSPINISALNAGMYLVKVTQNGVSSTGKLVVK